MLYFAYGSNMIAGNFRERCPSARHQGKARLIDYRLRFSRRSIRTNSGVADIVPAPGFAVMGSLWDVPNDEWDVLRRKEGVYLKPPAYKEIAVEPYSFSCSSTLTATTFVVLSPEHEEQIPSSEYIEAMVRQVESLAMPKYASFLRWLHHRSLAMQGPPLRSEFLIRGTSKRAKSRGWYIVRANADLLGLSKRVQLVSVEFGDRAVSAKFVHAGDVPNGVCEIDQNLRNALGISGKQCYGYEVGVHARGQGLVPMPSLVNPRNLCLKVRQTNWSDSEKRICVIHPNNMAMLGIKEGEYVEIECTRRTSQASVDVRGIRVRAFNSEARTDQKREYPVLDEIYLDQECRDNLGIPREQELARDYPVLVRPSLRHQLRRRAAVYGVTFFLGVASLGQVLALLIPTLAAQSRGILALVIATIAALLVAWIDVRSVANY